MHHPMTTSRLRISHMLRRIHRLLNHLDTLLTRIMEDDTDADSIDYPNKPEDGEEDDEDPSEEHDLEDSDEDPEEGPSEGNELSKNFAEAEPVEEDEVAARSPTFPLPPPINPTFDQVPLVFTTPPPGCDIAESSAIAAARASRGQYNFVDAVETEQGLVRSPGHDTRTISRATNRAEDMDYVRALQAAKRRMMTSIEEVNLRVSYQVQARTRESKDFYTQLLDAHTDRIVIRLEVDVVRGQRNAYETELQEVHQAYLRSEAQNRALLARLETLEAHLTRTEWQRQNAKNRAVGHLMPTQVLEARSWIDTVEDIGSSC
ncbi:hypothetical protein Tco_1571567 [Tanacetum coccineum]